MAQIRVLVVDDSAFMRKVIGDIIESDPELHVVARAYNGLDALKKVHEFHPDVVTMDVEMPGMDGISALQEIMRTEPVPVIMISSLTAKGADLTVQALEMGAVDFVAKPSGQISLDIDKVKDEIIHKVKIAAGTRSLIENIPYNDKKNSFLSPGKKPALGKNSLNKLILIGTSTGGPRALYEVIPRFTADLDAAILVVQHMPAGFTRSLADRLNGVSAIRVKEAEDGEPIKSACAYIAPGDFHLGVKAGRKGSGNLMISLNQNPPRGGHRPAVNTMFESVAAIFSGAIVAVIMTGMGQDGTEGLKVLKAKGARSIAEDQSTCIVYGMPRAAIEAGMVDRIVPLDAITDEVMRML